MLKSTRLEHCKRRVGCWAATLFVALAGPGPVAYAFDGDAAIFEAREALKKKDKPRLAAMRAAALAEQHPLAMWADYFDLSNRLPEVQPEEVEDFYKRWPGTYVEDRLRNDWLLELGKRRHWAQIAIDYPRFRMNDDREVSCYALLAAHLIGREVLPAAREAWFAQREADDGCQQMAGTLLAEKKLSATDMWRKARIAVDGGRLRTARQALDLLGPETGQAAGEIFDNPGRYLNKRAAVNGRAAQELTALALIRMASNDPNAASRAMDERYDRTLPADLSAWTWTSIARQAATKLAPEASLYYQRAEARIAERGDTKAVRDWSDETLAWKVRAALRLAAGVESGADGAMHWPQVLEAINAMSAGEQRDPAWVYWKGRALKASAADGAQGTERRAEGLALLASISGRLDFYGQLAAEDLGEPIVLPARPAALTAEEIAAASAHAGLGRALHLIAIGLRNEGVREWNFSLRGMGDRELLAAAQRACGREVWDRCINTSDRTRSEIDMMQRFPMPYRNQVQARAQEIGLDAAYVYGLIRQESRFVLDTKSHAGASGLMQLMPATARWTARRIGLATFHADMINDRDTNLRIGTTYLKLVLDDFGGSQAMAAAAYNAGPARSRKWREGPMLEVAAWAEGIPFSETRDYVKKVLSNATWYAALLNEQRAPSLKARMDQPIGPREAGAPPPDGELP